VTHSFASSGFNVLFAAIHRGPGTKFYWTGANSRIITGEGPVPNYVNEVARVVGKNVVGTAQYCLVWK
jgi:hypothetical protein